jgi:hypothetical protein
MRAPSTSPTLPLTPLHPPRGCSNEEVIAIDQDVRGRQGQRLQGGGVSLSRIYGDGHTPVTLQQCITSTTASAGGHAGKGAAVTAQTWVWNVTAPGFLTNPSSSMCMNVDDCGTDLIAFECVTTGGTCCGPTCYDNEVWALQADGTLTTPLAPGMCATAQGLGVQVSLAPCTGTAQQKWQYDATKSTINNGNGQCLTVGGTLANRTNVWGRPLVDGSWAVAFINVGLTASDITCDYASCLSGTGWEADQLVSVRDVWNAAELGVFPVSGGWNVTALDADGGVVLVKMTPYFNTTGDAAARVDAGAGAATLPPRRRRAAAAGLP